MLLYCVLGFVFVSLAGSVLHFVYDWLEHNKYISLFVAVNESTWEHLKLAIIPLFVWALAGVGFHFNNFAFAVFIALSTVVVVIPLIFYTYTYFTKKPILAVDISSFFIAAFLAMLFAYLVMNANYLGQTINTIGIVGCIGFAVITILFTYFPPRIFLFRDPITNKYGREGHRDDKNFGNNK